MKTLKIAMIGQKRIPSREGGVEIVVQELAVRMVALGHSVTVYNRRGHHVGGKKYDGADLKNYQGVQIRTVPTIDKRGFSALTSSFFASIKALFGRYDCIHYHAEGPSVMLWLPHLFGIHTVTTIHGLDWKRKKWGRLASWYLKLGEKTAVKFADEIVVLSLSMQQYFLDTYHRHTVLIPNGVSKPEVMKADLITKRWNLTKDSYLLFLGRIVPEKGICCLIDAFKNVSTDKKLVIAGGASNTESFMAQVKRQAIADSRILFTGFVDGRELEELYSNAYLYCLPSELEGMPLSLLEAMSYGNCCVTSDIPECTEVGGNYTVSFHRGSAEELRETLQKLSDNPVLVSKHKLGVRNYICNRYGWDDVVQRTLKLYLGSELTEVFQGSSESGKWGNRGNRK